MNDAKSAPFAIYVPKTPPSLIRISRMLKPPCIPPKISKSHNFGKLSEIRRPFPVSHVGNWKGNATEARYGKINPFTSIQAPVQWKN